MEPLSHTDDSPQSAAHPRTDSELTVVIFRFSGRAVALPSRDVERIVPMAEVMRPPGLPTVVEGILNLSGECLPVFRPDRLFETREQRISLYSSLVIVRTEGGALFALVVERVEKVVSVEPSRVLPLRDDETWNGCALCAIGVDGGAAPVLSAERILLHEERSRWQDFQLRSRRRLEGWAELS